MEDKNNKKGFLIGLTVLFLYTAGLIFVSCFHELWFDETQAWQIAKSASYKDIFTVVPHYEGHPPLWHLILSVFAKNGAPVDITLKAINITFCTAAMALLIFKSPFPKPVKYLLPFTYFFFFHYGIYNRPYSITMIAFFLMAMTYKERNIKPLRYVLSLILLCLTTAFGIMIAGGLCIVWTIEIIAELIRNKKMQYFWKDRRFYSLCLILAIAVVLILTIMPAEDCYYPNVDSKLTLLNLTNFKYLTIFPFESWSGTMIGVRALKEYSSIMYIELIIGIAMWTALISITAKNRKLLTFIVPYLFMSLFMVIKYMSAYHLGIGALLHLFIFWVILDEKGKIEFPGFMKKIWSGISSAMIKKAAVGLGVFLAVMPIVYSGVASFHDIKKQCGFTWAAKFIKDNHLEGRKILAAWQALEVDTNKDDKDEDKYKYMFQKLELPSEHREIKQHYTYVQGEAAMIQPFFDKNIFMNFNADCPDDLYMHYKYKEDVEAVFASWREKGLPDFIIGYCPIDEVYGEEMLEGVKYLPVARKEMLNFFKLDEDDYTDSIYIREDLLDEYPQLKWIDDQTGNVYKKK